MLHRFAELFSVLRTNKSVHRSAVAAKRPKVFRLVLEELESRLVPSSVPLHVVGTQLQDPAGNGARTSHAEPLNSSRFSSKSKSRRVSLRMDLTGRPSLREAKEVRTCSA